MSIIPIRSLALLIVLSLVVVAAHAEAPDLSRENAELKSKLESTQKENAELKARVQSLREQNAELQAERERAAAEIKELKDRAGITWVQPFAYTPATQPVRVAPAAPDNKMPPGSVERQFNGSTYYVVPLGEGQAASAPASRR